MINTLQKTLMLSSLIAAPFIAKQQAPVFRGGVDAVPLHVSVKSASGVPILDLKREDFTVLDNGKPADLVAFGTGVSTIGVAYLQSDDQRASSWRRRMNDVGLRVVENLGTGDRLAIGSWAVPVAPFTDDRALLKRDLDRIQRQPLEDNLGMRSWTSLMAVTTAFASPEFDKIVKSAGVTDWLQAPERPLWKPGPEVFVRAVIVASSGMEAGSMVGPSKMGDTVMNFVLKHGVLVFGLGFDGEANDQRLSTLAKRTGGWFASVGRSTDLAREAARILEDIHSRYVLGFSPPTLDGYPHQLEVRVNRTGAVVRARDSYVAVVK
jgi:VWFA-related protein